MPPVHPSRREVLRQLSRRGAALALAALFAPRPGARAAERGGRADALGDPFTLGVASGQPRADSVVLWTRLAPRPHEPLGGLPPLALPVRWELALDPQFTRIVREGTVEAVPEHAFSVHVPVDALPPAHTFHYRFIAGDAVSRTGRTRTAPAGDAEVERLRIALASCQHYEQGSFAVHREIADRDVDFVMFVGDYIYESNSRSARRLRHHEGPAPRDLDGYRARHATYKLDLDLQASHAAHPWWLVWDDHEVRNDYAGEVNWAGFSPQEFLRLRAAAYKAYFEHMPVSPAQQPANGAMRMHDRFSWGRLADVWTLDGRQYRSAQACGDPNQSMSRLRWHCAELADPARTLLGEAQEQWLLQGLRGSARRWKLMAQATQMSAWGVQVPFARGVYADGWDGYPRSRERLLRALQEAQVSDVVSLGGDVHRHVAAALRSIPNDEGTPVVASEFVTTSVSSRGLPEAAMRAVRAANPDLLHARSDERGYALLDLSATMLQCDFRAATFPVAERAALHTQARYCVEAGRAGPQLA